jgi:hypothetical protein
MSKKNTKRSEKEDETLGILKLKHGEPIELPAYVPDKKDLKFLDHKQAPAKPDKYWIKEGIACFHIDYPDLKMRVMKINQVPKEINDGKGNMIVKMFTVNIDVQWIDKDQKSQTAKYTTRELKPII